MNNLNKIYSVSKGMRKKALKVDKFISTYVRCFDENDQRKVRNKNHIGKLWFSLLIGPAPLASSYFFPYDLVYQDFESLHFVYSFPAYAFVFFATRELLGNITLRHQIRFKTKIYEKYKPEMDLTKDQIEELESQIETLRLEREEPTKLPK